MQSSKGFNITIAPFEGKSDSRSFEIFFNEYTCYCNAYNYDSQKRLTEMFGCLTKDTLITYQSVIAKNICITYGEMIGYLRQAYTFNKHLCRQNANILLSRKQNPDESVIMWSVFVREFVEKAYGFIKEEEYREEIAIIHFLDGLLPEYKDCERDDFYPDSLEIAVGMVMKFIKQTKST